MATHLELKITERARTQAGTIRLKLLKIGAQVRLIIRKIWILTASSFQSCRWLFRTAIRRIQSKLPRRMTLATVK